MGDLRVTGQPVERVEEALTAEALVGVGKPQRRFGSRRNELLALRAEHRDQVARAGTLNLLPERRGCGAPTGRLRRPRQTSPTDGWRPTAARIRAYVGRAEGGVMDEPATAQALAGAVLRGLDCGAVTPEDAVELTGIDRARLQGLARRVEM